MADADTEAVDHELHVYIYCQKSLTLMRNCVALNHVNHNRWHLNDRRKFHVDVTKAL